MAASTVHHARMYVLPVSSMTESTRPSARMIALTKDESDGSCPGTIGRIICRRQRGQRGQKQQEEPRHAEEGRQVRYTEMRPAQR